MKPLIILSFLLGFMFNQVAAATEQCATIFSPSAATMAAKKVNIGAPPHKMAELKIEVKTNSNRTKMYKVSENGSPSRLKIEIQDLSKNIDEAILELMRLLVNGPSYGLDEKNILSKNKIILGVPLNNGSTFLVSYESKSSTHPRFVIEDKVTLISPTNKEFKVTDGLLGPVELSLSQSEFDMPDYFEKDSLIELKIPLVLEGDVLTKLSKYSKYFAHIPKEELRRILSIESPVKRKTLIEIERAKSLFKEAILKAPFKILAQSVFMGLIVTGADHFFPTRNDRDSNYNLNSQTISVVEVASTKSLFTAEEALAKAQFISLRKAAHQFLSKREAISHSEKMSDLVKSGGTAYTLNENTFIFEKLDPKNNSLHTYIVFVDEKSLNQADILQYFVMEINAAQYAPMIKAVKAHQQVQ